MLVFFQEGLGRVLKMYKVKKNQKLSFIIIIQLTMMIGCIAFHRSHLKIKSMNFSKVVNQSMPINY